MVASVAMVSVWSTFQQKGVTDELLLNKIETLADDEYPHERCYGNGNVTCFDGTKVAYTYEHFNKTITVYCNAGDSPLRVMVTGNVK